MSTEENAHSPRRTKAGRFLDALPRPSLSLLVAVTAVVGLTTAVGILAGLSDVTIYMGLVALYVAMGAFGGTLKVDLSVAGLFLAALVLFVALPLLVSTVSPPAAAVILVVAVGICGILPALGRRYSSVRLGIGLITVYAYGYHATRGTSPLDIILGTFIAFLIVFVIRLIAAVMDRDAPLRNAVARCSRTHLAQRWRMPGSRGSPARPRSGPAKASSERCSTAAPCGP